MRGRKTCFRKAGKGLFAQGLEPLAAKKITIPNLPPKASKAKAPA